MLWPAVVIVVTAWATLLSPLVGALLAVTLLRLAGWRRRLTKGGRPYPWRRLTVIAALLLTVAVVLLPGQRGLFPWDAGGTSSGTITIEE
ncbi:MAG: hypothetical protein AB1416_07490 [Actinomycetota bacterium]